MKTLQKVTLAIALITLFASCQSSTDYKTSSFKQGYKKGNHGHNC